MAKREELKLEITAKDDASKVIDEVASKVEGLSSAAAIDITATDEASEVIDGVTEEVQALDDESAEPTLSADDEATDVVEGVTEGVEGLDEATAEPTLSADDQASGEIEAVSGELAGLDAEGASPTVDITDDASGGIEDVASALEGIDGATASATIEVDGEDAQGLVDGITGGLEAIGSGVAGVGLAAGAVAGMVAIGGAASAAIVNIKGLADATGGGKDGALEQASRLNEVWDLVGGSTDTLERSIVRVNDRLHESPELARQLGVDISANQSPMDVFIGTVQALNSGQLTANERLDLAMTLFGAKGVLILDDLNTQVGDIGDAIAAVGDEEIITQEDVDQAIAFREQWDSVGDKIGSIQRTLLPGINLALAGLVGIMNGDIVGAAENLADYVTPPWLDWLMGGSDSDVPEFEPPSAAFLEELKAQWALLPDGTQYLNDFAGASDDVRVMTEATADALAISAAAEDTYNARISDTVSALEEERDALNDSVDALDDKLDAQRGSADAYYAERDAARDADDAVSRYNDASAEGFENDNDRQAALDDVVGAYDKLAQAAVTSARTEREATGASLSRTESIDIENRSLMTQATNLDGPLRAAVLAHVLRINGIPQQRITEILTDANPNDLAQVNAELANASRTRKAAIEADADDAALANAESQLKYLARDRFSRVTVVAHESRGSGPLQGGRARGDTYTSSGLHLVGEDGPELVSLPGGADVMNAGQTAEWMRNRGNGGTVNYYTTQNFPAGVRSRDVRRAERRYDRTQAS